MEAVLGRVNNSVLDVRNASSPIEATHLCLRRYRVFLCGFGTSGVFRCIKWYKLYCWCFVLPQRASDRPFATALAIGRLRVQGLNSATKRLCDTAERATRSLAVVCEGDHRMGPGHTPFLAVIQKGAGRFSHYNDLVVFSSSDNTDPNSNGRRYKIVIPSSRCLGLAFLLAFC
jgi:hypothetical protein